MPPRGGQRQVPASSFNANVVLSHAPARGATKSKGVDFNQAWRFKSCPREGGNSNFAQFLSYFIA